MESAPVGELSRRNDRLRNCWMFSVTETGHWGESATVQDTPEPGGWPLACVATPFLRSSNTAPFDCQSHGQGREN